MRKFLTLIILLLPLCTFGAERIDSKLRFTKDKTYSKTTPHLYVTQAEIAVPNIDGATSFLCKRTYGIYQNIKYSMLCYKSNKYPKKVKVIGQVVQGNTVWTYEILLTDSNLTNDLLVLTEALVKLPTNKGDN